MTRTPDSTAAAVNGTVALPGLATGRDGPRCTSAGTGPSRSEADRRAELDI